MTTLADLRARRGLALEAPDGSPMVIGNLRGVVDSCLGHPDQPVWGDELVSIHMDHDPGLVNAYLEAHDPALGSVVYLHGFVAASEQLPQVYVLSDHREAAVAGQDLAYLPIGGLDRPEVEEWTVFTSGLWEVQISIDPSQRQTRRTQVQFSRSLALDPP